MDTEAIHRTFAESDAGRLTFPEVVGALMREGVESYTSDLVSGQKTCYLLSGETHVEKSAHPELSIAGDFSEAGLVAAIRAAQADEVRYPEFLQRASAAGTVAYRVFLTGRRAVYLGRKGEVHVEEFPRAAS